MTTYYLVVGIGGIHSYTHLGLVADQIADIDVSLSWNNQWVLSLIALDGVKLGRFWRHGARDVGKAQETEDCC
jgi:hypothetical protein